MKCSVILKRGLCLMLTLGLVFSSGVALPMTGAQVSEAKEKTDGVKSVKSVTSVPSGYTGITQADELLQMSGSSGQFILMDDIDLTELTAEGGDWDTGNGWVPIEDFQGTFNGNGHYIKGMHTYGAPERAGLFETVTYANIKNVAMIDVDIDINCTEFDVETYSCGAICAESVNSYIANCYVTGSIKCNGQYTDVGGLAGITCGYSFVWNCYNAADVQGYGISGYNQGNSSSFSCCYNVGNVTKAPITDRALSENWSNVFYLKGSAATSGDIGKALTAVQAANKNFYSGFDFDDVWYIDSDCAYKYPQLRDNPQAGEPETPEPAATSTPEPETPKPAATSTPEPETPKPVATSTPVTAETLEPAATSTPVTAETPKPVATYGPDEEPGSDENVYYIYTAEDLRSIDDDLSGYYILMDDIYLYGETEAGGYMDEGVGWTPLASGEDAFSGTLDGNGYAVIGMNIYGDLGSGDAGLFAKTSGALITNLAVADISIDVDTYGSTGGIVGNAVGTAIRRCFTSGTIANSFYSYLFVGGLVGCSSGSEINECYNTADVKGCGLCGNNNSDDPTGLYYCYNAGQVNSDPIAAYMPVADWYACYYLEGSAGFSGDEEGIELMEWQMQDEDFFAFDFDDCWFFADEGDYKYPQLRSLPHFFMTDNPGPTEEPTVPDWPEYTESPGEDWPEYTESPGEDWPECTESPGEDWPEYTKEPSDFGDATSTPTSTPYAVPTNTPGSSGGGNSNGSAATSTPAVVPTATPGDEANDIGDASSDDEDDEPIVIFDLVASIGSKVIKGEISETEAKVWVKIGNGSYKKAKVSGDSFTFTASKPLASGDKITVKAEKEGYETGYATEVMKVKLKLKKVSANANSRKIYGEVSEVGTTVRVKVGKKGYKKAAVSRKRFSVKCAKLTKGTKIVIVVTKANCKTATKTIRVK